MGLALVAFGGNLGDIRNCFSLARRDISKLDETSVSDSSMLYRNPPLDGAQQPDYLNAVILLKTKLSPHDLLRQLQDIEIIYGRIRTRHWGPRTLDLDLIAYNNVVLDTNFLTLPHPHMHERVFVLQPMCELLPDWVHPGLGISVPVMLKTLIANGKNTLTELEPW